MLTKTVLTSAIAGLALCCLAPFETHAAPIGASKSISELPSTIELVARGYARGGGAARGGMARRTTVVGPRGGVARTTTVRGGTAIRGGAVGVRGGYARGVGYAGRGAWVRPAGFYWRPGGAIAAGAAIGVVSAATAAAWAGAAPGPNMCWYYTDPSRTKGFWDACQ